MEPEQYFILHKHESGVSFYAFEYIPTEEQPWPDMVKLLEKLDIDYEPAKDEVLYVETLTGVDVRRFTAEEVGGGREDGCPTGEYFEPLEAEDEDG